MPIDEVAPPFLSLPPGVTPIDSGDSSAGVGQTDDNQTPPDPTIVAAPSFDPRGESYVQDQNVVLASATEGATIHYTTDGTNPTADSPVYENPILVTDTGGLVEIRAYAVKEGLTDGEVVSKTYQIRHPTVSQPVILEDGEPDSGSSEHTSEPEITITTATPDATILYTFDALLPRADWSRYTGPFTVGETDGVVILTAVATRDGYNESAVREARMWVDTTPPAAPTTDLVAGT